MIGRVAKIGIWIMIASWFAVIMGFVSAEADEILCNRIDIVLNDTLQSRFVTRNDVRKILETSGVRLQGYPLAEINTRILEDRIEENPYIGNAEVSKEITGKLEVRVDQRIPLVRILPDEGTGYFMDREGVVLPLSEKFTPYVMLVSGHVPGLVPGDEPGERSSERLREVFRFCSYLDTHPFWKDQIVQVYVNAMGEYELIPRVGAHQILFGGMDNWQKKLRNLELLYRQGFSKYGWNNYETINLKYTNQVICTKR